VWQLQSKVVNRFTLEDDTVKYLYPSPAPSSQSPPRPHQQLPWLPRYYRFPHTVSSSTSHCTVTDWDPNKYFLSKCLKLSCTVRVGPPVVSRIRILRNFHIPKNIICLCFLKWRIKKSLEVFWKSLCHHSVQMSSYTSLSDRCNSIPSSRNVVHSEPLLNVNVYRNFGLKFISEQDVWCLCFHRYRLSVIEYTKGRVIKWPVKIYVHFPTFFNVFLSCYARFLEHCPSTVFFPDFPSSCE